MKPVELKVSRIGNSRGIRIPAPTLERYDIRERVIMEERSDGILLRPAKATNPKLSWEETASEMANANEVWRDWDTTLADGLDTLPWDSSAKRQIAEAKGKYTAWKGRRK